MKLKYRRLPPLRGTGREPSYNASAPALAYKIETLANRHRVSKNWVRQQLLEESLNLELSQPDFRTVNRGDR